MQLSATVTPVCERRVEVPFEFTRSSCAAEKHQPGGRTAWLILFVVRASPRDNVGSGMSINLAGAGLSVEL